MSAEKQVDAQFRLVFGFLLAPLVGPLLFLVLLLASSAPEAWKAEHVFYLVFVAASTLMIGGFIAYLTAAVLGIPIFLFLRKRGHTSLWVCSLACSSVALIPWLVLEPTVVELLMKQPSWVPPAILIPMGFMATGAASGAVFWLIARPDRQA